MQQAVCVRRQKTKKTENPAAPKTHHEIHSSPATATISRRRAAKHIPRVSPYLPASIDPGFAEIGFARLSHSVKATNVSHTQYTDRYPDKLNNGSLYAPRYEEALFALLYGEKRPLFYCTTRNGFFYVVHPVHHLNFPQCFYARYTPTSTRTNPGLYIRYKPLFPRKLGLGFHR